MTLCFLFQSTEWPHFEQQVWHSTDFHPNTQLCHDWGQQAVGNSSLHVIQEAVPHSTSNQLPTTTFAPNPQARITCKLYTLNVQFNHLVYLKYWKYTNCYFCLCSGT